MSKIQFTSISLSHTYFLRTKIKKKRIIRTSENKIKNEETKGKMKEKRKREKIEKKEKKKV